MFMDGKAHVITGVTLGWQSVENSVNVNENDPHENNDENRENETDDVSDDDDDGDV